jgi:hypothetical protein
MVCAAGTVGLAAQCKNEHTDRRAGRSEYGVIGSDHPVSIGE